MSKLPNPNQIAELTALNEQVQSFTLSKPSRKKNWRILSVWRELRKHKIPHYFLSQNQIAVSPLPFGRSAFIIGIEKIIVPGASWSVDYYSVKQTSTGTSLSLYCNNGSSLIQKLLKFSFINQKELSPAVAPLNYEPYRYCDVCGERNKTYDRYCFACNSPLY